MSTAKAKSKADRASIEEMLYELRSLVGDAEELLRAAGEDTDSRFDGMRDRVEDALGKVKARFEDAEHLGERAKSAGKAADAYVRENPWAAVALAVGLGYLIGRIRRD